MWENVHCAIAMCCAQSIAKYLCAQAQCDAAIPLGRRVDIFLRNYENYWQLPWDLPETTLRWTCFYLHSSLWRVKFTLSPWVAMQLLRNYDVGVWTQGQRRHESADKLARVGSSTPISGFEPVISLSLLLSPSYSLSHPAFFLTFWSPPLPSPILTVSRAPFRASRKVNDRCFNVLGLSRRH